MQVKRLRRAHFVFAIVTAIAAAAFMFAAGPAMASLDDQSLTDSQIIEELGKYGITDPDTIIAVLAGDDADGLLEELSEAGTDADINAIVKDFLNDDDDDDDDDDSDDDDKNHDDGDDDDSDDDSGDGDDS